MGGKNNILAVDIGASKTNLGIFSEGESPLTPIIDASLVTRDFANPTALIKYFLAKWPQPVKSACIGVPGPIIDNQSTTTNLPWFINGLGLARDLAIKNILMVNDLEASAAAVPLLTAKDLLQLNQGTPRDHGNKAIISPGTGLGEAFLCETTDSRGFTPYPSEGGHCDFAPANPLQLELFAFLHRKIGHVSYEQVCSGLGIVNIYDFLKKSTNEQEPVWLLEMFDNEADPSKIIIDVALSTEKSCPTCRKTLEIFVDILGAEAGNMALKVMALGGVYLGGGIPPRITEVLNSRNFLKTFLNKGRMSTLLNEVPVHVIMNLKAPMIGAASIALSRG